MVIKKGKSQVTFVFTPSNNCRHVQVVGSFNNWEPTQGKMVRQKDGSFRKRVQLATGQHRYKFLVDDQWVLIGSANWDPRSLRLNFEFSVECYDASLASSVGEIIADKRARARASTLEELKQRSLPVRWPRLRVIESNT